VLLVATLARAYAIDRPWAFGDHNGWGGAFYSNIARNYLRYGYRATRLAPVVTTGEVPVERHVYYLTHPPLIGLSVSLAFRVFGENEWSARLVPLAFSVGSVALVYLIGSGLWSAGVGLLAASFAALLPAGIVYGAHVDPQGPPVTFFSLAMLEAYRRGNLAAALGALVVGAGFDWPVHYMAGLLAAHALISKKTGLTLVLPLASLVLVAGFFSYARRVAPRQEQNYLGVGAVESYSFWSGREVDPRRIPGHRLREPGAGEWLVRLGGYYRDLFTLPLLLAAAGGLGVALARREAGRLLLLLGWGALHVVLFPMGAYVHDYWSDYLSPGLALSAALGGVAAYGWLARRVAPLVRRAAAAVALGVLFSSWLSLGLSRIESSRQNEVKLGKTLNQLLAREEGLLSLLPLDARDAYYLDRPARDGVNRLVAFEQALADPLIDYRYFLVPRDFVADRPGKPLFERLETGYARTPLDGFYLYDLQVPLPPP
jgi:4-amino-4-deoxy-L-arabinose transferase-like glycosyltransferase